MKALLIAASLALLAGGEETDADRTAAHPWGGWTVGSWVRYEVRNSASGTSTSTESLVACGPDAYRLEGQWEGGEKRVRDHGYAQLGYAHMQRGAQRIGS